MPVTPEQIEQYFKELDWPYFKREERHWDSGYAGDTYRFRFSVRLAERWLYISWLFPLEVLDECRAKLYDHLLRLSFEMNAAKVMLDAEDDLLIAVELPNENLTVGQFEVAMRAVCGNVDRHFLELARLAREPNAVSSLRPKNGEEEIGQETPPTADDGDVDWSGVG